MGSYQPGGEVTGSIQAPPPQPAWTWDGGTAVIVRPGETVESIAREHGVPVSALMEANRITSAAPVYPGQHLVIPRYRPATAAETPPQTRMASTAPAVTAPYVPPRGGWSRPRARMSWRRAKRSTASRGSMASRSWSSRGPTTSRRIRWCGSASASLFRRWASDPAPVAPRAEAPVAAPSTVATVESPHSARIATPAPTAEDNPVKATDTASAMPTFRWPVRGRIIAAFGPKPNGLQNDGINLAVPEGTPIKAAEDGVVAYAGSELKGYGNLVLVRHANGFVTAYANASEILVKRGETVKRGQVIAKSGETGNVTSPQLHFEIRKGATPVDPAQYLSGA